MKPRTIMVIAGETSGDALAADLVSALRPLLTASDVDYTPAAQPLRTGLEPRFFGAGGPRLQAAGVELAFDMTQHSVTGVPGLGKYLQFRRLFHQLLRLARERQPDAILCVDFSEFNRRFAHAVKRLAGRRRGWFHDWDPKIIRYVSPQVWASREGRAYSMARDHDLLLSIFPFEKEWYARRVPQLNVEFVGHPMVERFAKCAARDPSASVEASSNSREPGRLILLLPGSRPDEVRRHLPVMGEAFHRIRSRIADARAKIALPNDSLLALAKSIDSARAIEIQIGGLPETLAQSDLAIASTGTVTMECAYFGVPTVTLYKTSWATYQIGRRIVKVKWLTMPNLLANEEVFPEFIQNAATPENISRAALELLENETRRTRIKAKLAAVVASLGTHRASERAAEAVARLLAPSRYTPTP